MSRHLQQQRRQGSRVTVCRCRPGCPLAVQNAAPASALAHHEGRSPSCCTAAPKKAPARIVLVPQRLAAQARLRLSVSMKNSKQRRSGLSVRRAADGAGASE